ncbi:MAG TPA: peptidyl-prolyl cis-trans isomerase [Caulobacteraceae bacterium]|nr:peptidyl-prolyl cis-trans isomerase [Caulobacteraceae bacterium]
MLRLFRAFAKSWFGPAIMGLLVIAFGFLGSGGIRSMFGGPISNAVVQAGSRVISPGQFQKLFQRQEQAYQQRTGQTFPLEQALTEGADKGMLQELSSQTAYFEMLSRSGIRPTDEVVAIELRRQAESGQAAGIAQIFDSVTGKFRPEGLQTLLQNNGITMAEFQRELADSIADGDFGAAIHEGYEMPRIYAAIQAALLLESRDVTYFVIPESSVPVPPKPTDAQLVALMQQNRERLMLPERRKLTIVRFSAKALAPTLTVDPAAIQQQFEAKKASYGKPELRSFIEIPLNDPKEAPAVVAALTKGEDPALVAKSVGVDPVTYSDQPQSGVADLKAGVVAFAMKEGAVNGPVQGDFKTVVLKVIKVTPAQAPDLAAARAQIEADLRQSEALDKVYDLSQKFDDARQGGASIADAAAKLGLTVVHVGPVPADGKDPISGQVDPMLSPKLLAAAFQLQQGGDSDVEQDADPSQPAQKGEYFAVHVDQVLPPNLPNIEEPGIRPLLTQVYMQQTIVGALQKKGEDAQAALKKGATFEQVAAGFGAMVSHQVGLQRAQAQQYQQTYGQPFLAAAFDGKQGQVFAVGSDPLKGLVIVRVDAVKPADPKQVAQVLELVRQRASAGYLEGLQEASRQAAVKMIKPHADLALARNAMGVDPAMAARIDKAAAASGGAAGAKPASSK